MAEKCPYCGGYYPETMKWYELVPRCTCAGSDALDAVDIISSVTAVGNQVGVEIPSGCLLLLAILGMAAIVAIFGQ